MTFDALMLSRLQWAWVIAWHILLPAFTVGLDSYNRGYNRGARACISILDARSGFAFPDSGSRFRCLLCDGRSLRHHHTVSVWDTLESVHGCDYQRALVMMAYEGLMAFRHGSCDAICKSAMA